MPPLNSLRHRVLLALVAIAVVASLGAWGVLHVVPPAWRLATGVALGLALLLLCGWLAWALLAPLQRLLRALDVTVLSYRDGDFNIALRGTGPDELGQLVQRHAELGQALREQRQHLAQRELLLDTVVQNTPVALLLVDGHERVVYANIAARQLLGDGRSLEGSDFAEWLAQAPPALQAAVASGDDALFSIPIDGSEESFHHSQRRFRLQGREHRLHLVRRMTRELSRQEVATWKRVIRVISHELNNSLAPISSLAHSGAAFAQRGDLERVQQAFTTIGERARHLHQFLEGYARFAKLPPPQIAPVALTPFVQGLAAQIPFRLSGELATEPVAFDAAQVEQALINLLKNAHESGGPADGVELAVQLSAQELRFEVSDRGPGMSEAVLAQAVLPLFSTKRSGSGMGLALVREIAEAHGGHVALVNRAEGGLTVGVSLRRQEPPA